MKGNVLCPDCKGSGFISMTRSSTATRCSRKTTFARVGNKLLPVPFLQAELISSLTGPTKKWHGR